MESRDFDLELEIDLEDAPTIPTPQVAELPTPKVVAHPEIVIISDEDTGSILSDGAEDDDPPIEPEVEDSDDDVIFVSISSTLPNDAELVKKAKELRLPENFYNYFEKPKGLEIEGVTVEGVTVHQQIELVDNDLDGIITSLRNTHHI